MARFTASINDELKERLDAFAEENGFNRSEALELMIRTFFEGKAGAPQPTPSPPPSPPKETPAPPSTSPPEERLDGLEARLELLQEQLRASLPVDVQLKMVEMGTRLNQMELFLWMQHRYLEGLHDAVTSNVDAHLEIYSRAGIDQELFVPGIEPPAPAWVDSSSSEGE